VSEISIPIVEAAAERGGLPKKLENVAIANALQLERLPEPRQQPFPALITTLCQV